MQQEPPKTRRRLPRARAARGLDSEHGLSAFAKEFGRSEDNVRTTHARLRELVHHHRWSLTTLPYFGIARPDAAQLLALCTVPGSADELWALYMHTARQIRNGGHLPGHVSANDVFVVLQRAVGAHSADAIASILGPRAFDATGALAAGKDDLIWLELSVPERSLDAFVDYSRREGFVADIGRRRSNDTLRGMELGVPRNIDRAALTTALHGAQALMTSQARDWLDASRSTMET